MTRDRGGQRSPLSPLRASNHGGGGAAAADAVGSSTKDRGWQRPAGTGGLPVSRGTSRLAPQSDRKKNKKVEGTMLAPPSAAGPPTASRIPAGPGARAAVPSLQQQQQQPASSSRIPRPPVFGTAAGASPQHDLVAMLATPPVPPHLEELQGSGGSSSSPQQQQQGWGTAPAPQGFHAYANPSYDGAQFLAATPPPPAAAAAPQDAGSAGNAGMGAAARVFDNGLAEVEAETGAATPGLLEPGALTPNTQRSLQAWLRASPTGAARQQLAARARSSAPPTTGGSRGASSEGVMPTPEAWQVLQHINDDSPPAAAPQGVRGIMNAFLRTGPQMLSPEPAAGGGMIRAPDAAAVPASGLLNVSGPGGAGVLGMMNACLRTSAHQLSPEPGVEAAAQAARPMPLMHPYSPVSPLAVTPLAGPRATMPPAGGRSPSSVCSNGAGASSGPAAASVPRLNLSALRQQQQAGGTDSTEVSFGTVVPAAAAHEQQPDSPGSSELPTARFSPVSRPAAAVVEGQEVDGVAHRSRLPSPITFCLPGDSPGQENVQPPASNSPTFSFGFGAALAGTAAAADGAAAAEEQADLEAQAPPVAAPEAGPAPAEAAGMAAGLLRISSGETVQGPNPFTAMLQHLRGPQYASPARFLLRQGQDSPQSPKECTPLHLISASDAASPPAGRSAITPAPGQGSLTVWMDRRGMRAALSTPARNDLRLLWAAAHDVAMFQSEAAALRANNAALAEELDAAHAALAELGVEQRAAVVAAEAGTLCAEAEVAKARDAAGHMMALAGQIQAMFQLCESEKEELIDELEAARQKLAASEAAAANATSHGGQQQVQLEHQLDEARQAVAAAQAAADAAQQRAAAAAAELDSIHSQLEEAQRQLAAEAQAVVSAAPLGTPAAAQTPLGKVRRQLGSLHESLAQLHAEHCAGRLQASTPELDRLLEASHCELAQAEQLLGGDAAALREENARLQRCLRQARGLLAESSPAGAASEAAYGDDDRQRSPLPFALFGRFASSDGEAGGEYSPATTLTAGACASPDVFSSPYMASQATVTVDYRDLAPHSAGAASVRQASPASPSAASSLSSEGSARSLSSAGDVDAAAAEAAAAGAETPGAPEEEQEEEFTVVHNGMIITHVPASEVSKVKSMVQYWEAVASGTPVAAVTAEEAAEAEAYASAAYAAAEAAMVAHQAQAEAAEAELVAAAQAAEEVAAETQPGSGAQPSPGPSPIHLLPEATPVRFASSLPAGDAATPGALPLAAAASTPARQLTPLSFVAAPPPTPADGVDPQQAQQLHHLAISMAMAATPTSAQRTASRLPGTPAGTPAGSAPLALAVTPLALSALRARLGGSVGGVQDAVRSRLARLKADLAAAQAKLAAVDLGLASIALTPTSSITNSGTPGSRSSSLLRRTLLTPSTGAPLGSPLAPGASAGSPQLGASPGLGSSRAAALIAAGGMSPLGAMAGASPPAVSQPINGWQCTAAAESEVLAEQLAEASAWTDVQDSAPAAAAAAAECTPLVTRRSVRFADTVQAGSNGRAPLRHGTPYSAAAWAAEDEDEQSAASSASPVVGSCRRSPLGFLPAASPAAASTAAAAWRRSPLGPMQSAAKPAADQAPMRRFAFGRDEDDSGSSSSDEDDNQLRFDASRMGQRANQAASPSPLRLPASTGGATPMAHPEPPFGGEEEEAEEGYGSYGGVRRGGSTTPGASMLSTSSFSPPQPLVMMAVRPLGRSRRGGMMRGGSMGRPRSEAEEREFRRRAAALNIPISPYFNRRTG